MFSPFFINMAHCVNWEINASSSVLQKPIMDNSEAIKGERICLLIIFMTSLSNAQCPKRSKDLQI